MTCDGEDCQESMRIDQAEAYITLNDGSKRYACAGHMRIWRQYGFIRIKAEES